MHTLKRRLVELPFVGRILRDLHNTIEKFPGSTAYWERRYQAGGNSGAGSYGKFAAFKAEILNQFVADNNIASVIEFGCGDGNQLGETAYPNYLGIDVSEAAVSACRKRFAGDQEKRFIMLSDYAEETADLALSLDVIFHLVEDTVFEDYMRRLFAAAERYVIVYSSNDENIGADSAPHVRHRRFTDWVDVHEMKWRLLRRIPNRHPFEGDYRTGSFADFYIFEKAA